LRRVQFFLLEREPKDEIRLDARQARAPYVLGKVSHLAAFSVKRARTSANPNGPWQMSQPPRSSRGLGSGRTPPLPLAVQSFLFVFLAGLQMLFLLIAIAICLFVPWLPVLMYRNLPRRTPPPPGAAHLHLLAAEGEQYDPPEVNDVVYLEEAGGRTDITRQQGSPKEAPCEPAKKPRGHAAVDPEDKFRAGSRTRVAAPQRLALGSYRWINLLFVPLFIVTFLALTLGWAALFHYLGEEHARTFPSGVFLFKPISYGVICALPGLFLGILTAIPSLALLARLVLSKRRFIEYLHWDEGRIDSQGMNPDRLIRLLSVLALLVSLASVVFVSLVMNWYACFTEDEIVIKRLFGLGTEVHRYDTVQEIVVTTHRQVGKDVMAGPDLGLRFSDGRTWSTDQTFELPRDPRQVARLLDFLRRKTGKPIAQARLLKDVPGW
jgi:hypothetical protein